MRLVYAVLFFIAMSFDANATVMGAISAQSDTVHLEFSGRSEWVYNIDKKGSQVVMTVDPLNADFVRSLERFSSDYVKKISVDSKGIDGQFVVKFELASDDVEVFDYLTDQPSRLILDFYLNPSAAKASSAAKETSIKPVAEAVSKKAPSKNSVADSKKASSKEERKPATADTLTIAKNGLQEALPESGGKAGIFDGADPLFERFSIKDYEVKEDSIIRSKNNYYLPYPMLRTVSDTWEQVKFAPAIYQIKPEAGPENKMARLLLTLFEKKRYLVYLKTLGWFKEKYPNSQYNDVIDFMTADVHLELWKQEGKANHYDQAQLLYSKAVKDYPNNPLSLRTSLKQGYLALEKGDALAAIQMFQRHLDNPNFSGSAVAKDLAKLGRAQAFTRLNQYESALNELDEVVRTSTDKNLQMEAQFRRGDVYTQKADANVNTPLVQKEAYRQAIKEYQTAMSKYPKSFEYFPNAYYNVAESQFWLDERPKALESYRDFVVKFPSHKHAPFALTRIGELLEIMGADRSKVMGAYLETYFRFGEAPSAIIARMRLLSGRMKGMKPKELDSAVAELKALSEKIELPNMHQFSTVLTADGFTSRREYDKAAQMLISYYQDNPTTVNKQMFQKRIVANINSQIEDQISSGDFIAALKTHSKYSDTWLKGSKRLDTSFFVGHAFEKAGVEKEAEKYYKDVLNRTYALAGSPEEKELRLMEDIPSLDVLNLRLASISAKQNQFKNAYEYLKAIKSPEKMTEEEQIERVDLAVRVLDQRGEDESAIRYLTELIKTWKGKPNLVAGPYLKLAQIEQKMGRSDAALTSLELIDTLMNDSKKVDTEVHFKSLQMRSDILSSANRRDDLIPVYEKMLKSYEESRPLGSIRYKLGEIYFNKGNLQKANQIWNEFKGEKTEFWARLAQEKLKNSQWTEDYKKYIQRIPAMSTEE